MKRDRYLLGILFVLMGLFLIIGHMDFFPEVNPISLALILLLVIAVIKSLLKLKFAGILFPLALIYFILHHDIGFGSIAPLDVLLAALLGTIGLSLIFHKGHKWIDRKSSYEEVKFEKVTVDDGEFVNFKASFSETIKYINTNNFVGADFNCSFGAMKIYFDKATMANESAVVKLNASFSGIELFVPRGWKVENKTNVFLGGVNEKNRGSDTTTNTLILVGEVSFAGVEIIYI